MYPVSSTENRQSMTEISDRVSDDEVCLVAAIARGDSDAENELVTRFLPRVRAMLLARTRDFDLTADLSQDVLLAAICALRRNQLRETTKLSSFVLSIARNILNEYYRNTARTPLQLEYPEELPDWDRATPKDEEERKQALALRAIEGLDLTDRLILQLTLVDGLKPGAIALQLSRRPDWVRQRKLRATRQVMKSVQLLSQNETQAT